jgi:hypothetical protein
MRSLKRSYTVRASNATSPLLQGGALPLQLVLQHAADGFEQNQQALCSLLCSSKAVHQALRQRCAGMAPVCLTGSTAECQWLTKYGVLAKELHVDLPSEATQQVSTRTAGLAITSVIHEQEKMLLSVSGALLFMHPHPTTDWPSSTTIAANRFPLSDSHISPYINNA